MTNRRHQRPTCVGVVLQCLVTRDDFMRKSDIVQATGLAADQVGASLHDLQRYKAADCVVAHDELWWFATPATDQRTTVRRSMPDDITRKRRLGLKRKPKEKPNA